MTFRGHFGRILIGTPGSFHVAAPSVAAARVTPGAGGRRRDRDVITQNRVYRARHTYTYFSQNIYMFSSQNHWFYAPLFIKLTGHSMQNNRRSDARNFIVEIFDTNNFQIDLIKRGINKVSLIWKLI